MLLPVATNSRELLPRVLKEMGWNVDLIHSYKTIKPKHFQPFDLHDYNADYIVFTSPSTVVNFIEMYGKREPTQTAHINRSSNIRRDQKETFLYTVNRIPTTQQASSNACVIYLTKRNKGSRSN